VTAGDPPRPSARFLAAQLLAGVCVLLGAMPVLAALGLMRASARIEPWARPVALLFGCAFLVPGLAIVALPLRYLAVLQGAHGTAAVRLGLQRLRERIDRPAMVSAVTTALVAAAYWAALAGATLPAIGTPETLAAMLSVEFLVIHGFPFFVLLGALLLHSRGVWRTALALWLGPLIAGYGVLAWHFGGGAPGLAALGYLLVPNVVAMARSDTRLSVRAAVASRWCLKFATFVLSAATVGDGTTAGAGGVAVGAAYFTLMAMMELVRAADLPVDLAVTWNTLPGTDGERVRALLSGRRRP